MAGLKERLQNGGTLVVAEGYVFELERRGYLKAGSFVPEVTLDHPDVVRQLHEEFVHAGSDVVLAFTYYAHREKLRVIGREHELDAINSSALKIAREVADRYGCLMAGNICNTNIYVPDDPTSLAEVESMFKEQIELAVQHGADFIVGETYASCGEAMLALQCIQKYGNGLPAVLTLSAGATDVMSDGVSVVETCRRLKDAGSDVVGLNCGRGPSHSLPLIKEIVKTCKGPIAALPNAYRTNEKEPTMYALKIPGTDRRAFPLDVCACQCSRTEICDFALECRKLGVQYVGLCCGNAAHLLRCVAEAYGRTPPASKFAPDMEKHYMFGTRSDSLTDDHRKAVGATFD